MTFQGKLPPYGMPPAGGITERPELKEFDFFAPPGGPGGPGPGPGSPGPGPGGPGGPGFDGPPPQPKSDDNERAFEILGGKCVQKDGRVSVTGTIGDSEAVGVAFSTDAPSLCGIFVNGDSKYAVRDSEFRAVGDGKNDFAGDGAVLLVDHDGELEVCDTKITTVGCIRPCTTAMGDSTLRVYNCVLTGEGGTLPDDYVPVIGPGMKTPPEGLEIGGNCRTHLSVGNSKAYFYDSTIIADGWAALSTDGCTDSLYLEANNCDVICRNSGYGVYSDGGCNVVLNGCRMNTATHGAIMAGECTLKSRDTQWKSGEYGFMIHCVMGMPEEIGDVSISGGSIETASDSFFVKSQNAYIDLQGVSIQSGGAIVHSIVNPDVCATKVPAGQAVYGIKVSMTDMDVSGDLIHEDPDRTMSLSLKGTKLSGKLENVYLSLDSASAFTAAADSTVCLVGPCAGKLDAPTGVTIFATAGEGCDLTQSTVLPSGGKLQF